MARKRIKVVLSMLGIDGHDRGILLVSRALRDAGMEVIYLGSNNSVEEIVRVSIQEGVDVVGVSSHCEAHLVLGPKLAQRLKEEDLGDVPLFLGGLILPEDIPRMKEAGIYEVFEEGAPLDRIVKTIESAAGAHDRASIPY